MPNNADALLALADLVEAATKADRRLDRDIWQTIDLSERALTDDEASIRTTEARRGPLFLSHIKPFTASLDAAMTLVPEGWDWEAASLGEDGSYASAWKHGWKDDTVIHSGGARFVATPALALTAAALRALAQGADHAG